MIDELIGWGITPPVVVGDGACGDNTELRTSLERRDISYVLDVKGVTSAYARDARRERPDYQGRGQPPKCRYQDDPSSLRELALAAGQQATVTLTWREGTRGQMSSRFLALRVRPANIELRRAANKADADLAAGWLLCEWPEGKDEPVKYWLSNLPDNTDLTDLVRLGKLRWRIEQDYRELKDALGLDHYEGRTYPGWNHHVTLVSVAHAFLTLQRSRRPQHKPQTRAASSQLRMRPNRKSAAPRAGFSIVAAGALLTAAATLLLVAPSGREKPLVRLSHRRTPTETAAAMLPASEIDRSAWTFAVS